MKYLAVLKDNLAECGGPTMYNMGPYCGTFHPTRRYNKSMTCEILLKTLSEKDHSRYHNVYRIKNPSPKSQTLYLLHNL